MSAPPLNLLMLGEQPLFQLVNYDIFFYDLIIIPATKDLHTQEGKDKDEQNEQNQQSDNGCDGIDQRFDKVTHSRPISKQNFIFYFSFRNLVAILIEPTRCKNKVCL